MIYDIIIDLLKHLLDTLDFLKPYATTVGVIFIILRQNNIRKIINGHLPRHFRDNRDYDIQEIKSDLKDIKNHLGIGVGLSNLQPNGQETTQILSYKRFFLLLQAITKHQKRRMVMDKLKSRKLWLAIFGALFPVLNVELGINLDPNMVFGVLTVIVSGIAALAHVDAKKAQSVVKALKTSIPVDPDATYRDMIPTIQAVHDGINNLLKVAKTNDINTLAAYAPLLELIKSFEHPEPLPTLPTVPDEQVSA